MILVRLLETSGLAFVALQAVLGLEEIEAGDANICVQEVRRAPVDVLIQVRQLDGGYGTVLQRTLVRPCSKIREIEREGLWFSLLGKEVVRSS